MMKWQLDLSDCKCVALVRGAAGIPALLVGQSLPSPLVGLMCFSSIPIKEQNWKRFHKNGMEGGKGARDNPHLGWLVQPCRGDLP